MFFIVVNSIPRHFMWVFIDFIFYRGCRDHVMWQFNQVLILFFFVVVKCQIILCGSLVNFDLFFYHDI